MDKYEVEIKWFFFQIVAQLSGLLRHEIMDFMFSDPTMLDDLDFLYKSDTARKLMFYYQVMALFDYRHGIYKLS